ncbi:MAG: hypothetical protein Q9181_007764 [Wetmoreana brouardii]
MWQAALNAVYRLSTEPLRRTWPFHVISSLDSAIKIVLEPDAINPSNLQTRFVIWSIQYIMFNVWEKRLYRTVGGRPTWQGEKVGTILIWKQRTSNDEGILNDNDTITTALGANEGTLMPLSAYKDIEAGGNIEYKFQYEGTRIDSSAVFLAALMGIGNAAEAGLDSRCAQFIAHGSHLRPSF